MSYLNGVELLRHIEKTYDVMSISFRNVPVWPFLRIYLLQVLGETQHQTAHKVSPSKISIVLKSILKSNVLNWLKHYPVWVFNARERRKNIEDKWVQRVSGFMNELNARFLDIEKPSLTINEISPNLIEESNIVSEGIPILIAHLLERFLRFMRLKINNEHILTEIVQKYAPDFDYRYYVRYLWSQKITIKTLISLSHPPEVSLIECPYNMMGYIWGLKEKGVKIIELQHGVINKSHYAYILPYYSSFSPDELWVYGDNELAFFRDYNPHYSNSVIATGLYILQRSKKAFVKDIFSQYRNLYDKIVVFSGQSDVKEACHKFISKASSMYPEILFVYIPRNNNETFDINMKNVLFRPGINIYEYLIWCDIHMTISSTTCLEASYFNKPTIFYDFNNLASTYYKQIFSQINCAAFISSPSDMKDAIETWDEQKNITYGNFFAPFNIDQITSLLGISNK